MNYFNKFCLMGKINKVTSFIRKGKDKKIKSFELKVFNGIGINKKYNIIKIRCHEEASIILSKDDEINRFRGGAIVFVLGRIEDFRHPKNKLLDTPFLATDVFTANGSTNEYIGGSNCDNFGVLFKASLKNITRDKIMYSYTDSAYETKSDRIEEIDRLSRGLIYWIENDQD